MLIELRLIVRHCSTFERSHRGIRVLVHGGVVHAASEKAGRRLLMLLVATNVHMRLKHLGHLAVSSAELGLNDAVIDFLVREGRALRIAGIASEELHLKI